ncbi:hypothetical protein LguiA_002902 [Lonicera macranthoides]
MILAQRETLGRWWLGSSCGTDKKDERIQELTTELHVKKRLSAAYREQLITVMKDSECQNEHLSSKLQVVSSNLKDLAAKPRGLHHK